MSFSIKGAFSINGAIKSRDGIPNYYPQNAVYNGVIHGADYQPYDSRVGALADLSDKYIAVGSSISASGANQNSGRIFIYDAVTKQKLRSFNGQVEYFSGSYYGGALGTDGNCRLVGDRLFSNEWYRNPASTHYNNGYGRIVSWDIITGARTTYEPPTPEHALGRKMDVNSQYIIATKSSSNNATDSEILIYNFQTDTWNYTGRYYTGDAAEIKCNENNFVAIYYSNTLSKHLIDVFDMSGTLQRTIDPGVGLATSANEKNMSAIDGDYLVVQSGLSSNIAKVFKISTGETVAEFYQGDYEPVQSQYWPLSIDISGDYVILCTNDYQGATASRYRAYIFQVSTGTLVRTESWTHTNNIMTVRIHKDSFIVNFEHYNGYSTGYTDYYRVL